jgi:hypothetical protein
MVQSQSPSAGKRPSFIIARILGGLLILVGVFEAFGVLVGGAVWAGGWSVVLFAADAGLIIAGVLLFPRQRRYDRFGIAACGFSIVMELLGWVIGASLRNQSVFVPYVLVHLVFYFYNGAGV